MKHKYKPLHLTLLTVVIGLCLFAGLSATAYAQGGGCVDCDKNKSQLNGHGAHSTSDPRRVINVKIDASWGAQTNANVWNATRGDSGPGAISAWNAVGSPYYLEHHQDASDNDTDFLIKKDSSWDFAAKGCAYTGTPVAGQSNTQRVVHLPADAANWSQSDLACILAHEIGHGLGLAGSFPPCQSIMTEPPVQSLSDCHCAASITENDVAKTNQFASNATANCGKDGKAVSHFGGPGDGYIDPNPFRYYPTCYYFYDAYDVYEFCDCNQSGSPRGYRYVGTIYVLTDYFCY